MVVQRLPTGSGWSAAGSPARASRSATTLERSLLIALVVAGLLGLLCGVILAHYVGAAHRRHRRGRQPDQRARPDRSACRFRAPAMRSTGSAADQRDARPDQRADGGAAAADRQPRARPALAGQPACAPLPTRPPKPSDPGEQEELLGKRHPPGRRADANPDRGARDQPIGSADRPQAVHLVRRRRARRRACRNVRSACRGARRTARVSTGPPRPVPLFGHRQLLAQAISNLVENAIRYGSDGGEIRVRVSARRAADPDRGRATAAPAFRPSAAQEARRRFGRLDSSRSDEGAGLGLALAEAIAHLHEGELHPRGQSARACSPFSSSRSIRQQARAA